MEDEAAEAELFVGDHTIGSRVYVKGMSAAGEAWFEAEVLARRERYPPLQVKYVADLFGGTSSLALPTPTVAFVPHELVLRDKPPTPAPKRARRG